MVRMAVGQVSLVEALLSGACGSDQWPEQIATHNDRIPIRFFLGLGSRYSYLAAARIGDIAARYHRIVEWLPVYSPDLIAQAGADPFSGTPPATIYPSLLHP
jgi:2-hydroxychromene-2-carboxylate isomerase